MTTSRHPLTPVERFFHAFEQNSSTLNTPALLSQWADTFLAAGPQGAQPVRAADFALALPKRKQLFDSLGLRSTALASLHETRLDARYTMAATQWRMTFARAQGDPIEILAASVFILDTSAEDFKIVFYLASQDIFALLKENGLTSA
jgi:hypothetical protein